MFYSQINRDATPLETVRCGLSCVSVQLHIPKRSRTSRSTSYSSSHSFGRTELQSAGWCIWCKTKTKNCLKYLWNTRLSVQCNFMPCLLILVLLLVSSMIIIWEQSNGYYFYHQITLPLLYPTTSSGSNGLSAYEMHHKLSVNYPNAHVIAGIVKKQVRSNRLCARILKLILGRDLCTSLSFVFRCHDLFSWNQSYFT